MLSGSDDADGKVARLVAQCFDDPGELDRFWPSADNDVAAQWRQSYRHPVSLKAIV
jgi:hypothetical protein